jgi:uncharacterized protein (TIGR00251 family)
VEKMKIHVKVIPRAKNIKVECLSENEYKLWVAAPPVNGKANQAVIELLGKHFKCPPSRVVIIKGKTSNHKIVDIDRQ